MAEHQPGAPAVPGVTCETLCENEWVSLKIVRKPDAGVNGYVYSHETRCQGRIVAVLPYRDVTRSGRPVREYLVKSEMTPCWGFGQVRSAITGGYEGGDIEDDAVREMLEETGYAVTRGELVSLGESFASKSADTVYSLFSVDLTGRTAGEAVGDGSRLEAESAAVWVDAVTLAALPDPQLALMCMRIPAGCGPAPESLVMPADEFAAVKAVARTFGAVATKPCGCGTDEPCDAHAEKDAAAPVAESPSPAPAEPSAAATGPAGRVREDAARARELISGALLGELARRICEYENAITWDTSCTSCARVLDSAYAETVRREQAEAKLAEVRGVLLEGGQDAGTVRRRALAIIGTKEEDRG